jgi:hypothetical protein
MIKHLSTASPSGNPIESHLNQEGMTSQLRPRQYRPTFFQPVEFESTDLLSLQLLIVFFGSRSLIREQNSTGVNSDIEPLGRSQQAIIIGFAFHIGDYFAA